MKLSELKPCALCGGPLVARQGLATWYVLRVSQAMVSPRAASQVMGLSQIFGGSLGLAEVLAPDADGAVMIFGDKDPRLMQELHICFDCFHGVNDAHSLADLPAAIERHGAAQETEETKAEGTGC